jgi:hypothetical protein
MLVTVVLNGTNENPYHKMGLKRNPFPTIARADLRFRAANEILADLAANPIRDVDDLRRRMEGCTPEFVEGCVARFQKGKRVRFTINFPDESDQ